MLLRLKRTTVPERARQAGFTVMEVVLALSLGIIILGGVTVGYIYGKNAMLTNNMRTEVQTFKTFVEDARSAKAAAGHSTVGPTLSYDAICGLMKKLPSLQRSPFTSENRVAFATDTAITDTCVTTTGTANVYFTQNYAAAAFPTTVTRAGDVANVTGSSLFYLNCDSSLDAACSSSAVNLTMSNGVIQTAYGYAIFETDQDGNLVAAAGGDKAP